MFVVRVFVVSSIDHVPKFAVIPCIAALLSSAVTWFTLSEANFGTSDRKIMNEYPPFASNVARPFGFLPQRSDLTPSLVWVADTSVQVPTSCSLSDFCWLILLLGNRASPNEVRANRLMMLRRFMWFSCLHV